MALCCLILHYGTDALLADARVRVLEDAGYEVLVATTPAVALRLLRSSSIEAVIVCHSVPPDELQRAVREMKQIKRNVPVLAIHVGGLLQPQRTVADGFIDGLRGPEHLLSRIATVIGRSDSTAAAS